MNVAIIGAGLMGRKRADSAKKCNLNIKYISDQNEKLAKSLASDFNAQVKSWKSCVEDDSIDMIFVCTSHDSLKDIAYEAIKNGKHVLIEKPAGRNIKEIQDLITVHKLASKNKFSVVKVGFNHRFHPMIAKAKKFADSDKFGKLLYMTAEYGHGGRKDMEKEWRCNKSKSGGGELLDQGSHLIDLYRWFFGNPVDVKGLAPTYLWKSKDQVEDNAFILLKNKKGNIGHFHVSWTMWKNFFQMKITGTESAAYLSGLGKSYGLEHMTVYSKDMGKVLMDETYDGEDKSFTEELKYFLQCIKDKKQPEGNLNDALENMKIIEEIYNQ